MNTDIEAVFEEDDLGAESEEDLSVPESAFSEAVIWSTDWTTETIVSQLRKNNLDVNPIFQRRDAWDNKKKSTFIESLILGIPVPPVILAERKDKKNSFIVIDGKQRLLSLMQFSIKNGNSTANVGDSFNRLKLSGLKNLSALNGLSYEDLENDSNYSSFVTQFDNQPIRTIVIRNWQDEEFLYTIFHRLNTGSTKLNSQELRQALHPAPSSFIAFLNDFCSSSEQLKSVLKYKKLDKRMRDIELFLRYYAFKFFLSSYDGNLKKILDKAWESLIVGWEEHEDKIRQEAEELNNSIDFVKSIFGERNAFSKYSEGNFKGSFNRGVFDIMVYYFSIPSIRKECEDQKNEIKQAFIDKSMQDSEFVRTFEYSVKGLSQVKYRFNQWRECLNSLINSDLDEIW